MKLILGMSTPPLSFLIPNSSFNDLLSKLTSLGSETSVGHDMVIDETDDLHVAVNEGQRASRVTVMSFVEHIHTLKSRHIAAQH